MTTQKAMTLDPEIARLCDAPGLPVLPALSRLEAEHLCSVLVFGGATGAYACGWKPQHVAIWLPVVQATFAAVGTGRPYQATEASARGAKHLAIAEGVVNPPRRRTRADEALDDARKFNLIRKAA